MKLQTLLIVDGQSSMLTLTVLWLEDVVLVYERDRAALLLRRLEQAPTYGELMELIRQWNGRVEWSCSGTHAAVYWLLVHRAELPSSLSVQSVLEAIQQQRQLAWDQAPADELADQLACVDRGTRCTSLERWTVGEQQYWLVFCRQGAEELGGQALCYNGERALNLWIYPHGSVTTLPQMRTWLASYNGTPMLTAGSEELCFYWLQSYGRARLRLFAPLTSATVPYDCAQAPAAAVPYRCYEASRDLLHPF